MMRSTRQGLMRWMQWMQRQTLTKRQHLRTRWGARSPVGSRRSRLRSLSLWGVGALVSLGSVGCANDTTGPALPDPAHLYFQLTLNHDAITLALTPPYDTLQLVATPRSATGAALADSGVTTWTSNDTTSVRVSPTGQLTALAATSGVTVTVRRTIGRVTQTTNAIVNVYDTTAIPRVAHLVTLPQPVFFGFPIYDLDGLLFCSVSALDAAGDTIPGVVIKLKSMLQTVLATDVSQSPNADGSFTLQNDGSVGLFHRHGVGHALLVTEATIYGVHRVDTLSFTVGWQKHIVVGVLPRFTSPGAQTPVGAFTPAEDTVAAGGDVAWVNGLPAGQMVDVVFDDPTAAQAVDSATFLGGFARGNFLVIPTQGGGNIPAFAPLDTGDSKGINGVGVRARSFPTAGTYRYHSALYGTSGIVHVIPEDSVP